MARNCGHHHLARIVVSTVNETAVVEIGGIWIGFAGKIVENGSASGLSAPRNQADSAGRHSIFSASRKAKRTRWRTMMS
jgi:hypothetical protein